MIERPTPSLRISRLVISNFRTFRGPTEIVLSNGQGVADAMPVFHGGNGTGKSNALAALDLFFRAGSYWLRNRAAHPLDNLPYTWNHEDPTTGLMISPRMWPPGVRDPLVVEMHPSGGSPFSIELLPAGNEVLIHMGGIWKKNVQPPGQLDQGAQRYLAGVRDSLIEAPIGPGSRPFFVLDARRHDFKTISGEKNREDGPAGPFSPAMAESLHAMMTSFEPSETERWRAFTTLLSRFKTLNGREISIVRMQDGAADLRFEIRGRQILRVSELSSGEQQAVALCAAVLTSRSAIVAIEEPELSLHPDNQELIKDILLEQVKTGLVDQIILESHVPIFDGPEVLRFFRSADGVTSVERQVTSLDDALARKARERGAEEQWVTPEGYTKLPVEMQTSLGVQAGGHLWFFQTTPRDRWEAWTAEELNEQLGFKGAAAKE